MGAVATQGDSLLPFLDIPVAIFASVAIGLVIIQPSPTDFQDLEYAVANELKKIFTFAEEAEILEQIAEKEEEIALLQEEIESKEMSSWIQQSNPNGITEGYDVSRSMQDLLRLAKDLGDLQVKLPPK